MTTGKQADEQTGNGFTIEEVTDFGAAWPALEALTLGIIEYHRPWDDRELRSDWSARMREHMAGSDGSVTFVALSDGRTVGFISGNLRKDYGIFDDAYAFIENAFVEEQARRLGAGTALLAAFEGWCRARGGTDILLNVATGNQTGIDFWSGRGFDAWGHTMRKTLERTS